MGWFLRVRVQDLPPNMSHAWRVNRYADTVCNGGLANFLSTSRGRGFSNEELLVSLNRVAGLEHAQALADAIDYKRNFTPRLRTPKASQMSRWIAFDLFTKGASHEEATNYLIEHVPDCLEKDRQIGLRLAAAEVEIGHGWEKLNKLFYSKEPDLRECVAEFAEKHMVEWRDC